MAEVIHVNYLLLPILNRFDIQLGFGDKTISEICAEQKINVDFFLEIINSFHDYNYFPQDRLQSFPLDLIIEYILKSHYYYINIKVPLIETTIITLSTSSDKLQNKYVQLIVKFFQEYKEELINHITDEEIRVYPYMLSVDKALRSGNIGKELVEKVKKNPIRIIESEHTNIEDKLFDLKNIIIKYLPPATNYSLSNTLLIELFRLEQDLNDHARIEDKVLVPKVEMLENQILQKL